jgi:mRNA-degrading endonuclease toxin of MazEF toxin-antitoxin module
LVPFPFTDLSGRKRRSTLVVSPERFRRDLILCAITSQVPERLSEWEVALSAEDLAEGSLPKPSVIRVAKLFTMHTGLILGEFGNVQTNKLLEVLDRLQKLFRKPSKT